jgi:hypothetical protein
MRRRPPSGIWGTSELLDITWRLGWARKARAIRAMSVRRTTMAGFHDGVREVTGAEKGRDLGGRNGAWPPGSERDAAAGQGTGSIGRLGMMGWSSGLFHFSGRLFTVHRVLIYSERCSKYYSKHRFQNSATKKVVLRRLQGCATETRKNVLPYRLSYRFLT